MNIHRHASSPNHQSALELPATEAMMKSTSSEMKMPVTIASCCREPNRPRSLAGAISAMYAGAITEAIPTPRPPMIRKSTSTQRLGARPVPRAATKKRIAAIRITISRPMWSANRPASSAPAAAPSRAEATAKPSVKGAMLNCFWMAEFAPLMTALS